MAFDCKCVIGLSLSRPSSTVGRHLFISSPFVPTSHSFFSIPLHLSHSLPSYTASLSFFSPLSNNPCRHSFVPSIDCATLQCFLVALRLFTLLPSGLF